MGPILLVIAIGLGYAWWNAGRAAAERATAVGRDACKAAGVIWLDQSVHAAGIRLRRNDRGRLSFERSFRFEYSWGGDDRHVGRLVLCGDKLVAFVGPAQPTVVPFERRD
ncbi:MAG: DUF3301 domain-containing protein [Pseudoxanthomonas sp.]